MLWGPKIECNFKMAKRTFYKDFWGEHAWVIL